MGETHEHSASRTLTPLHSRNVLARSAPVVRATGQSVVESEGVDAHLAADCRRSVVAGVQAGSAVDVADRSRIWEEVVSPAAEERVGALAADEHFADEPACAGGVDEG